MLVTDDEHLERTAQRILVALSLESADIPRRGANVPILWGDTILRLIKPVKGSREEWMWATNLPPMVQCPTSSPPPGPMPSLGARWALDNTT